MRRQRRIDLDFIQNIEHHVKVWLPGKNGMIGVVHPDHECTEAEWHKLHEELAKIIVG